MADCNHCGEQFTEGMDGRTCSGCFGWYCQEHFDDHVCQMLEDPAASELELDRSDESDVRSEEDEEEDPPEWMFEELQLRILPEPSQGREPIGKDYDLPEQPFARGPNRNVLDEDHRRIGVATWNLHGLNDRRYRGELYAEEIQNRLKALGEAVAEAIALAKGTRSALPPVSSRTRSKTKKSPVETAAKTPETDEEIAAALATKIEEFWVRMPLRSALSELNQAPSASTLKDLLARLLALPGTQCSVATATECSRLRARTRRIVGSENAWKNACSTLPADEQQYWSTFLDLRKNHPLCGVLAALVALDRSLNTHLVISHINELMAKNPWLDAFILQEVRPGGLALLAQELDESLRITSGPCMAGVADTLNQREYYPVVTRASTIRKVTSFAIACVKNDWCEPVMPEGSSAKHNFWTLKRDEDPKEAAVYRGEENAPEALDTVNVLWSKKCGVYRPAVVHELTTGDGIVTIGNVHTSPGEGDNEWWRQHEYDQLQTAFEAAGKAGFWLMGGDYYLSAEARVLNSGTADLVTDLKPITYDSVVVHYEEVTRKKVDPQRSPPTIGQAQRAIFSAQSVQQRPEGLRSSLELRHGGDLQSEDYVPQPFVEDFRNEVADTRPLDANSASEDIFRNVLGLTFEKVLPDHWRIAQAISGTNTHLKVHDFPAYAIGQGKVALDCIERARRFTRARVTSKMRIADFFIYNKAWRRPAETASLACKIGLLAPTEVGAGTGIHWYDEENLAISRYWLAISDHFPVGGVFTTDLEDPALAKLTAAPFMSTPMRPSGQQAIAPESEADFELVHMPQDGDCFFECLKRGLALNESVEEMRQHAQEESKLSKVYVGWPDWDALARHYGVTIVVHEYHYGDPDRFVRLLPEVNPHQKAKVHMRLIHVPDQTASHMDLLLPRNV